MIRLYPFHRDSSNQQLTMESEMNTSQQPAIRDGVLSGYPSAADISRWILGW